MPALQPLSMQIGALPPGYSTLTPLPSGPALQYGFNYAAPSLVQQVALASTVAAPATFTLSGIASTATTSYLVVLCALAQSGAATVSTPTNWTALSGPSGSSAGNSIGLRAFVLPPPNAGGITSVVFTTLTGVNGIACWFAEYKNVYAIDGGYNAANLAGTVTSSNSSTAPSTTAYTPTAGPVLLVGAETDLTGQAYTAANVGAGWTAGTTATSTTGATNCIIRPFFNLVTTPELTVPYQVAGTLAGALANSVDLVSLLAGTSGPLLQPQPQAYPVATPAMAGWGALGNTKPGGAGSGQ